MESGAPLTQQEMREARLRALGLAATALVPPSTASAGVHSTPGAIPCTMPVSTPALPSASAGAGSMEVDAGDAQGKDAPMTDTVATSDEISMSVDGPRPSRRKRCMTEREVEGIRELMWPRHATEDDITRWHQQGFVFQDNPSFGLVQGHGGPCGVLAAVQGEILRLLIFGNSVDDDGPTKGPAAVDLPAPSPEECRRVLADALLALLLRVLPTTAEAAQAGDALARDAGDGISISLLTSSQLPISPLLPPEQYVVHMFSDQEESRAFLTSPEALLAFQSPSGVLLFVYSILLTRGIGRTKADMDAEDNTLTGQFGHCTQELLNLLLLGKAVSNVFDGERALGDSGLTLKGVSQRPGIGYLTHLEALRYVQVGSQYKSPLFPIWVIGSSSHFSVLFSLEKRCNEESEAERLLARVQRAFKKYDPSEGGFLESTMLRAIFFDLDLQAVALDDAAMGRLKSKLEVQGANIILWDDFWQTVSRLLTGATVEQVLSGSGVGGRQAGGGSGTSTALIEYQGGPSSSTPMDVVPQQRPRSDSDIARELQAQFDADMGMPPLVSASPAPAQTPPQQRTPERRPRSDSDLAREMQAEYDRENDLFVSAAAALYNMSDTSTTTNPASSATPGQQPIQPPSSPVHGHPSTPTHTDAMHTGASGLMAMSGAQQQAQAKPPAVVVDGNDDDPNRPFVMFHYNGLAGPGGRSSRLACFSLTKRGGHDNVVGHSVAFGASPAGTGSAFACPIEEVLLTKWPGARFNWHGSTPPSID